MRQFEAIAEEVADLVLEVRRRALGRARRRPGAQPVQGEDVRPDTLRAFREIKRTFDPHGLLNPARSSMRRRWRRTCASAPATSRRRADDVFDFSDTAALRGAAELCSGRRRVPQEARRHDVPVVHGDARRAAHDARPRQRAAAGDDRPTRRVGPRRRRRLRGARPVPRVQGVQGGMPGRRGRGALQERVPRRLLAAPWHTASTHARSVRPGAPPNGAAGWRRCPTGS